MQNASVQQGGPSWAIGVWLDGAGRSLAAVGAGSAVCAGQDRPSCLVGVPLTEPR